TVRSPAVADELVERAIFYDCVIELVDGFHESVGINLKHLGQLFNGIGDHRSGPIVEIATDGLLQLFIEDLVCDAARLFENLGAGLGVSIGMKVLALIDKAASFAINHDADRPGIAMSSITTVRRIEKSTLVVARIRVDGRGMSSAPMPQPLPPALQRHRYAVARLVLGSGPLG